MPIRFAVKSGNFSDPTVWDNGAVPVTGDDVYANGFTVTLDTNISLNTLRNDSSIVTAPNIATPVMTNFTLPSGIVSSSSSRGAGFEAYQAFKQDGGATKWSSAGTTGTLTYQFPTSKIIKRYIIRIDGNATEGPRNWTFEGSNDGTTWTVLDTATSYTFVASGAYVSSILANTTAYTYYRLNITANNGATWVNVGELEMTESIAGVGNTAGGSFSLANGINITITASNGLIASVSPLVNFNLTSGNSATLNATMPTVANIASFSTIVHSGTGTLNINGNATLTSGNSLVQYINFTSAGILNMTGTYTISSTGAASGSPAIVRSSGSGTINIIGSLYNTSATNNASNTVIFGSANVNVTGNLYVTNTTNSGCISLSSGNITITGDILNNASTAVSAPGNLTINGNVTPNGGLGVSHSTGNLIVNGNVSASVGNAAITTSTSGTVTVNGTVTASSNAIGLSSSGTGVVTINGNIVNNSNGMMAVYASRLNISAAASQTWNMFASGGVARNLLTPDQITVSGTYPSVADVRSGTSYGLGTYTGTCAMPSYLNVTFGVPVDAGVGKAYTPDNIADLVWNKLTSTLTVSGSAGERIRNIATVHTTGAQIAAMRR